ncbi:hypothetical protein GUITHDRAFT_105331 [Guillardia theta CCMP2712]|uniref:Uncharacterized protein n=1 Tax=Guillardia theta (strain CCMP2712) TaxID=905079 RepID=L1JKT7_GUITC|nr:hypothetical protein GUITHDRAFT_105331 [Guillardia theta CCMP2712]EKX48700.1 hypothetical protein GUITHDRAFT_105331 [Guillardia theta CCMP2712]|eukprot:XP_005835680.1 hypothetical protein GUITHDRAFT_105331 [Guillardia theta CCMP2712]
MIDIIKHNLLWDVSLEANHNESVSVIDFIRHTLMKSKSVRESMNRARPNSSLDDLDSDDSVFVQEYLRQLNESMDVEPHEPQVVPLAEERESSSEGELLMMAEGDIGGDEFVSVMDRLGKLEKEDFNIRLRGRNLSMYDGRIKEKWENELYMLSSKGNTRTSSLSLFSGRMTFPKRSSLQAAAREGWKEERSQLLIERGFHSVWTEESFNSTRGVAIPPKIKIGPSSKEFRRSNSSRFIYVHGSDKGDCLVLGQWRFRQGCNGGTSHVSFIHVMNDFYRQAYHGSVTLRIEGGTWTFQNCNLYCKQGDVLHSVFASQVAIDNCDVGGLGPNDERACNGVVVKYQSSCNLTNSSVVYTGYSCCGSGVKYHDVNFRVSPGGTMLVDHCRVHTARVASFALLRYRREYSEEVKEKLNRMPKWRELHAALERDKRAAFVRVRKSVVHQVGDGLPLWLRKMEHGSFMLEGENKLEEADAYFTSRVEIDEFGNYRDPRY